MGATERSWSQVSALNISALEAALGGIHAPEILAREFVALNVLVVVVLGHFHRTLQGGPMGEMAAEDNEAPWRIAEITPVRP